MYETAQEKIFQLSAELDTKSNSEPNVKSAYLY